MYSPLFGVLYLLPAATCFPIMIRTLYVFITYKQYWKRQCYKLIAVLLMLHTVSALGYICSGVGFLYGTDLYGLLYAMQVIASPNFFTMMYIGAVLAINRVSLFYKICLPSRSIAILVVLGWALYVAACALRFSPFEKMNSISDGFVVFADVEHPFTAVHKWIHFRLELLFMAFTITLYVLIITRLVYMKLKCRKITVNRYDVVVFVQAFLSFAVNCCIAVVYHLWVPALVANFHGKLIFWFLQINCFLILPLVIHLSFNRKLVRKVFVFKKSIIDISLLKFHT
ncbi:hypothetical protein QR680_006190 [Steinernema hermaphroditum]|uniref:Serpentine receptor class gamma n=1 Tax=Steinernema hermaphroditum TaxID=289476 RepID=A0AA39LWQ3_9BILA|nr:hypothetical protein QR680_006190 [Steinernema hermaphroditum]